MAQFQLVGCQINLGGDRGSVVVRGRFNPVTYPEYLLLQVVHGGDEHVHHAMSVGYVERDNAAEFARLSEIYGGELTRMVFPGPVQALPLGNEAMLTEEEYQAGEAAKAQAQTRVRSKKKAAPPAMELPVEADALPVNGP